jgi:hypothetical protein
MKKNSYKKYWGKPPMSPKVKKLIWESMNRSYSRLNSANTLDTRIFNLNKKIFNNNNLLKNIVFNKYIHPKVILNNAIFLLIVGFLLTNFKYLVIDFCFFIPYTMFYIEGPYLLHLTDKLAKFLLKFKNKEFLIDLFFKWLILNLVRFLLIHIFGGLHILFPTNSIINFNFIATDILNISLFRVIFPLFIELDVIKCLNNINITEGLGNIKFFFKNNISFNYLINNILLDNGKRTLYLQKRTFITKDNNGNPKVIHTAQYLKYVWKQRDIGIKNAEDNNSFFNTLVHWKNKKIIIFCNLFISSKESMIKLKTRESLFIKNEIKQKHSLSLYFSKIDFKELDFRSYCKEINLYPTKSTAYAFLKSTYSKKIDPSSIFSLNWFNGKFSPNNVYKRPSNLSFTKHLGEGNRIYYSIRKMLSDNNNSISDWSPYVNLRGGASSPMDLDDVTNDSGVESEALEDSGSDSVLSDFSQVGSDAYSELIHVNFDVFKDQYIRYMRFNIANMDLASEGHLTKSDVSLSMHTDKEVKTRLKVPFPRDVPNSDIPYYETGPFKSLFDIYLKEIDESQKYKKYINYILNDLFLLDNNGKPKANSPVEINKKSLNKFTANIKNERKLNNRIGQSVLNTVVCQQIIDKYKNFISSNLDKEIDFYVLKKDANLTGINKQIVDFIKGIHETNSDLELSWIINITIRNTVFKKYETTASKLMSYFLKYYFITQDINIVPENTQKNRKRPDYVVYEIFQYAEESAFIFVEVKFDDVKLEDVLDQVRISSHYEHNINKPDGSSGVRCIILMGRRLLFLEIFWYDEHLSDKGIPNYKGIIPLTQRLPYETEDNWDSLWVEMNKEALSDINFPYTQPGHINKCTFDIKDNAGLIHKIFKYHYDNRNPRDHTRGE